jgi:hypothetical protein
MGGMLGPLSVLSDLFAGLFCDASPVVNTHNR